MFHNDAAPRIARVLLPPNFPSSVITAGKTQTPKQIATSATNALLARTDPISRVKGTTTSTTTTTTTTTTATTTPTTVKHVCTHPCSARIAYAVVPDHSHSHQQTICVQDAVTQQVIWNASWHELALVAYWTEQQQQQHKQKTSFSSPKSAASSSSSPPSAPPPPDPSSSSFSKWVASYMGSLQQLAFDDLATLHWSGMVSSASTTTSSSSNNNNLRHATTATTTTTTTLPHQHGLIIQTSKRILIVNLHRRAWTSPVLPPVIHPHDDDDNDKDHNSTNTTTTTHSMRIMKTMMPQHLSESNLQNQIPTSNPLPLTPAWLLIGCADGSLKCFDRQSQQTVKSIKGLGNDWMISLQAANSYANTTRNSSSTTTTTTNNNSNTATAPATTTTTTTSYRRRMITLTKKGTAYLIEIELTLQNGTATALEIKPPLARFVPSSPTGGGGSSSGSGSSSHKDHHDHSAADHWEYQPQLLLQYDAHRDWVLWYHHSTAMLQIWNLKALAKDLVKAAAVGGGGAGGDYSSSSKTHSGGIKPDPSLQLELLGGGSSGGSNKIAAVAAGGSALACTAWGDDEACTFVTATLTQRGDLFLQGALVPQAVAPHARTVQATAVLGVQLAELLQRDAGIADVLAEQQQEAGLNTNANLASLLQVQALKTFALGPTSNELLVVTNLGMFVLQIPLPPVTGTRHLYFGAWMGSLGKSILSVHDTDVVYASIDTLTTNPIGAMEPKNPVSVFSSPRPTHLPHPVPFRAGSSVLLPSPSGLYVALWWPTEFKYEILHLPTLVQTVEQSRGSSKGGTTRNPCVASGTGVADICWVGDDPDIYALLHVLDWEQAISALVPEVGSGESGGVMGNLTLTAPKLKELGAGVRTVAMSATSVTKNVTKAATSVTKAATSTASKTVNKGFKKSFGLFGKKKKGRDEGGMADMTEEEDGSESVSSASVMSQLSSPSAVVSMPPRTSKENMRYVELRQLVPVDAQVADLTVNAATSSSLGELALRGGNRTLPTIIFGGPVLCVGSRTEDSEEGEAHFYAKKKDENRFAATGPTLPYPDLCVWDDDGRLCAVSIGSRVAVYLSEEPDFVLLGTVRIGSPTLAIAEITSLKFLHGVLYCCTWNSVHCVFLGDQSGGVCHFDSYLLASSDVASARDYAGTLEPCPVPLPLAQPIVLGYQSGSLMLSTLRGVFAVPLEHPVLRIGILLASDQVDRAIKWFDAVDEADHEELACFLERRGHVELAMQYLTGLSLQTSVDLSMRHGDVKLLEDIVENYGARGLRAIDMGRGLSTSIFGPESTSTSMIVCVGAYLLAHGRLELVRQLASECLRLDDQGKKDAFYLGTLLLQIDEADASRLIQRAVDPAGGGSDDWLMGKFVYDFFKKSRL